MLALLLNLDLSKNDLTEMLDLYVCGFYKDISKQCDFSVQNLYENVLTVTVTSLLFFILVCYLTLVYSYNYNHVINTNINTKVGNL